jgi:hypothetical protein
MEEKLGVKSFFMMDENFLLHKRRALELLERMKQHNKAWALYVFSLGQCDRAVYDAGIGGTRRVLGMDGAGVAALFLRQAQECRHAEARGGTAAARNQTAWVHHRRTGASYSGEH